MENKKQCIYEFGPFELDSVQHLLLRDHKPLALTPKTYDALLVLVKNSGRLLPKAELMQALWPDSFVEESNLTVQISAVRKVLGDQQSYIVTVPGRGYRFSVDVNERSETQPPPLEEPTDLASPVREPADAAEIGKRDWMTSGNLALHEVPRPDAIPARSWRPVYWVVACGLVGAGLLMFFWLRPALPTPRVLGYTKLTDSGRVDLMSDTFTDGTRVYFVGSPPGSKDRRLYQASVSDRETSEIPIPLHDFFLCAISPDHSQLLVGGAPEEPDTYPLWIVSVLGGSPRRLGDIKAHDAAWTPDGKGFIYSRGTDIFLANADGTDSRKLLTAPGFASGFRWSPDRRVMRFTVTNQTTSLNSIWEAFVDGSHLHELLPVDWNLPSTETGWGDWTPDGRYFLFQSTHEGKYEIWTIREKTDYLRKFPRGPVLLSTGPARLIRPQLSVDGKQLFATSLQNRGELLRFDPRSSQFVPFLVGLSAHRLSFTNDRKWITYITYPEGELWRSRADGTDRLRLTFPPMQADLPRWSPDGSQIVFKSKEGDRPGDMFLVSASGGQPKRLLPAGMSGSNPDWSPDGKFIAFGPQPTFLSAPNASGSETTAPGAMIHLLDVNSGKISDLPDSNGLYWPRWSPDGRYIAALSVDTHKLKLYDNQMRTWSTLASGSTLHNPLWCRDGKSLYFQDLGAPGQTVYRLDPESRRQEPIRGPKDLSEPDTIYSAFTGLAPDDAPILLQIHSIDDLYALDVLFP